MIFQVKYKPDIGFFDKLNSFSAKFNEFPHWETNRLQVSLRDFDKKHSLNINHEAITYETDDYNKSSSTNVINLIDKNFNEIKTLDKITRFGIRFLSLSEVDMSFEELNSILKVKYFLSELTELLSNPYDISITTKFKKEELDCYMNLGPMKKEEVRNYIKFNTEQHIDPSDSNRHKLISSILDSYPETAVFCDFDLIITDFRKKQFTINEFYELSMRTYNDGVNQLLNYIFEEKLK